MTTPQTFNVYFDESCHLEHDGVPVMAWGAVTCEALEVRAIAEAMRGAYFLTEAAEANPRG